MSALVLQIPDAVNSLPVPIKNGPYWALVYRPVPYVPDRLSSLSECKKVVEKTRVQLRGWDFPHLPVRDDECHGVVNGSNWVGAWTHFLGNIEYWQLFQSGQFIHFAAVREATEEGWRRKLQQATANHLRHKPVSNWDEVPGFLSLVNLVYVVTEYFEFAARLCQAGVYQGSVEIGIGLYGIEGYVLTTEGNRVWTELCRATSSQLSNAWSMSSDDLIADSAEPSLKAIVWVCERFGWMEPNLVALKEEQERLLTGRL